MRAARAEYVSKLIIICFVSLRIQSAKTLLTTLCLKPFILKDAGAAETN